MFFSPLHLIVFDQLINPDYVLLIGLLAGILSGLLGVGGAIIAVPLLFFMGIPNFVAVGTAPALSLATGVTNSFENVLKKQINYKFSLLLTPGTFLGIAIGIAIFHQLHSLGYLEIFLAFAYISMLLVITVPLSILSLRNTWLEHIQECKPDFHKKVHQKKKHGLIYDLIVLSVLGLVLGLVGSLLGLGGGSILVPFLLSIYNMKAEKAIALSLFQLVFVSLLSTILQSYINHSVDIFLAFYLIISAAIGTRVSVLLQQALNLSKLQKRIIVTGGYILIAMALIVKIFFFPHAVYILNLL